MSTTSDPSKTLHSAGYLALGNLAFIKNGGDALPRAAAWQFAVFLTIPQFQYRTAD